MDPEKVRATAVIWLNKMIMISGLKFTIQPTNIHLLQTKVILSNKVLNVRRNPLKFR